MKRYFARLCGDIVGIDCYVSFTAESEDHAQAKAAVLAEENYSDYDEPFDEDEAPRFHAVVEEYDLAKHYGYEGNPNYTRYS
jgi:hypothetical protein